MHNKSLKKKRNLQLFDHNNQVLKALKALTAFFIFKIYMHLKALTAIFIFKIYMHLKALTAIFMHLKTNYQ